MAKSFNSKVVGVTFKNDDGSDRQQILKACKVGQKLQLIPTPTKKFPNSVSVCLSNGKQIGYLNDRLGKEIITLISTGGKVDAKISNLTGGTRDRKTRGCNIQITKVDKEDTKNGGCLTFLLVTGIGPLVFFLFNLVRGWQQSDIKYSSLKSKHNKGT